MNANCCRRLISAVAVLNLISACGAGSEQPASATESDPQTVTPRQDRLQTNGFARAPVYEIRPTPYSSLHFDNGSWLGTPVGEPARSTKGPIARLTHAPGKILSPKSAAPSNRTRLAEYRAQLIESADHLGPVDGYQYAEHETAKLAQQHGHDPLALQAELNNRLTVCRTRAHAQNQPAISVEELLK